VKVGLIVVGVLVLLAGAVFAGQGLGYIPGSFMTGDMKWFWIGSAMVVVGLAIGLGGIVSGRRQSRV
jgi:F0F1-type ATP synthase membrane subunit c/vacuolar-type H+-ATPase subunit K